MGILHSPDMLQVRQSARESPNGWQTAQIRLGHNIG